MKLLALALCSSAWALNSEILEFKETIGLEEIIRVEDGGSIKAELVVGLTQNGIDDGYTPNSDFEIFLNIDSATAIKAEHGDDPVIYR